MCSRCSRRVSQGYARSDICDREHPCERCLKIDTTYCQYLYSDVILRKAASPDVGTKGILRTQLETVVSIPPSQNVLDPPAEASSGVRDALLLDKDDYASEAFDDFQPSVNAIISALPLDSDLIDHLLLDQLGEHDILAAVKDDQERDDDSVLVEDDENDQQRDDNLALGEVRKFVFTAEPRTLMEALGGPEADLWQRAADEEYNSLLDMKTFVPADLPPGRRALTCKWVFKKKLTPTLEIDRYKARVVARGFQQVHGIDFKETFASVVKTSSYRLLLALCAILGWICRQSDFKTAFLNPNLDEEIYMKEPEGYAKHPGKVLRVLKGLYGLKQSARLWYRDLRKFFVDLGFSVSSYDESVFFRKEGDSTTILATYVDDILMMSPDNNNLMALEAQLSEAFEIRHLGECERYLGIEIARNQRGEILLHQGPYIDEVLERFDLTHLHPKKVPMAPGMISKLRKEKEKQATPEFQQRYQGITGSWQYAVSKTRPDVAKAVSTLSQFNSNPNEEHMAALEYLSAYLKGTRTHGISYGDGGIEVFVDASHQDCPDTLRSTSGWVVLAGGGAVNWASRRQSSPSISSCESEYKSATEAVQEAIWVVNFLGEIGLEEVDVSNGLKVNMDSQSAIRLAKNPEYHGRTKHIAARHHFIRHAVESGDTQLAWVPTKEMVTDGLIKPLPRDTFKSFRERLGIRSLEEYILRGSL